MDWAKAKTILIVVFLASNLFLGYMIIGGNNGSIDAVDSEKIGLITDYLSEKNIVIKGQVPEKKMDMSSITVKYKLFRKEEVIKNIFSPEEKVAESAEGDTVILKGKNKEVTIKECRELNFSDASIGPAASVDKNICTRNIKEFLGRLGMKDDANIRLVEDREGYKRFIYEQSFRGMPIYNSMMEFYVNNSGVRTARIIWFESIKQAGRRADVISPAIALLYLPEYQASTEANRLEVMEILQGYYFGTGARSKVDASKIEEGTAFPVWKITTNRDIIYINAYNEKVEGVEKARN